MDDITVKMVCQEAGISRQALYNHFYCLPDVLQEVLVDELDGAVKDLGTYNTWASAFEAILENLLQQRTVLLHVYRSGSRGELMRMLETYGARLVGRGIRQCAEDLGYSVAEEDAAFMLRVYMVTFMGILNHWFDEGMRMTPAFIASRCDAMMGFSIRGTLKRLYGQG